MVAHTTAFSGSSRDSARRYISVPSQRDTSSDRCRILLRALALALGYAVLSKFLNTVVTAFGQTAGTIFWPGAGLSAGLMLTRPRREWPWYVIAVAVAEFMLDATNGYGSARSAAWAIANAGEPLLAAALLTRGGRPCVTLAHRQDLWRFVAAAVLAGPAFGAVVGTAASVLFGAGHWWPLLGRWYVGDAIGVLVVAPMFIVAGFRGARRPAVRTVAGVLFLALPVLVALGPWSFPAGIGLPFLVVPILVVIAMRAGPRGAACRPSCSSRSSSRA